MDIKIFLIILLSRINYQNCKGKILNYFNGTSDQDKWLIANNSNLCPKKVFYYVKYIDLKSNFTTLNNDYYIYNCVINKNSEDLDVPSGCRFEYTYNDANVCVSEEKWRVKAESFCSVSHVKATTELVKFSVLFKCGISESEPVCCTKLNAYDFYKIHLKYIDIPVKSDKQAFELAKRTLHEKFKKRQEVIQNRFILEKQSINIWSKHPKLVLSLEHIKKKIISEMDGEVKLLKELETFHVNRIQNVFEENVKNDKARLKYTIQETKGYRQANRIIQALKLGLQHILSGSEDITDFYETLLKEDLSGGEQNKKIIHENFNSLIIRSWGEFIEILNKVPDLKDEIHLNIKNFTLQREKLIKRFIYLDKHYTPRIPMKSQAENYVKNMISVYGHGLVENKADAKEFEKFMEDTD